MERDDATPERLEDVIDHREADGDDECPDCGGMGEVWDPTTGEAVRCHCTYPIADAHPEGEVL